MKILKKNVDKYIRKTAISMLVALGIVCCSDVQAKAEYKKVGIDESVSISTMSEYKDMDYTFLEEFPYGTTYEGQVFVELETAQEMIEASDIRIKSGRIVQTQGFYEVGDGGAGTYRLLEKATEQSIQLANGVYAELIPDTKEIDGNTWVVISVKQLGAKGDGEQPEHMYINQAVTLAEATVENDQRFRGIVYLPKGEYKCTHEVHVNAKKINFVGTGNETVIFTDNDYKKDIGYYEFFFMIWGAEDTYLGDFKVEAREVDLSKYMRQVAFIDCNNVYMYGVHMNVPQEAFSKDYYVDKQYTNLTFYSGNKNMTLDNCRMDLMCATYRGANLGVLDFYCRGEENITIMNSEFHSNARDEQIGMFTGVTNREASYIKNVDFINNTIYSYSPIDKQAAGGHRTMCFTIAYTESRNIDDIRVAGNHFISDVDSKLITFGNLTNCVVENNMIEVRSTQGGSYIFDSSNSSVENILIQNNEFYLTGRWNEGTGKGSMLGGKATIKGNKIVSESYLGSMVDVGGIVTDNTYINFSTLSSGSGNSDNFSRNTILSYGKLGKIVNLKGGYTNNNTSYYNDNYVVDYRRENYQKGPWDSIVGITCGAIEEVQFNGNTYLAPNRWLIGEEKLSIFYNKSQVGTLSATGNTLQGVDGYVAYGGTVINGSKIENNTILPFTYEENIPMCSEITLTRNGQKQTEIFTTESTVSLEAVVKTGFFNQDTGVYDNETETKDKEIDWYVSLDGMADVQNGVVTRKNYGTVIVYAVPKDGSYPYVRNADGKYEPAEKPVMGKCTIHFVQDFATDIRLEQREITLQPNKKHQVIYEVLPKNQVSQELVWTSSDESVATVRSDGLVEAVSQGNATITCTTKDNSNISKNIQVTVEPLTVKKINLNDSQWYDYNGDKEGYDRGVSVGDTYQLEATSFVPENAVNCYVGKWISTNEKIATVDEKGLVTAVGPGVCEIRAYTSDEKYYSAFGVWVNPAKLKNVQAEYTHNSVTFHWESQENVHGYRIYQYDIVDNEWKVATEINDAKKNEWSIWNLNGGSEYRFYVTSYIKRWDINGYVHVYTEPSEEIVFTTYGEDVITNIKTQYNAMGIGPGESKTIGIYADKSKLDITSEDESVITVENLAQNGDVRITALKEGMTYLSLKAKDAKGYTKRIPVVVFQHQKIKNNVTLEGLVKALKVRWKVENLESIDGYVINKKWGSLEERQLFVPKEEVALEKDEEGNVYGTYIISGLENGKEYSLTVAPGKKNDNIVYPGTESASVSASTLNYINVDSIEAEELTLLNVGESKKITATIKTEQATKPELIWKIYKPAVVEMLESGMSENIGYATIKGLKPGISKVNVIATDENNYQCQLKVVVLPEQVKNVKGTAESKKISLNWEKCAEAEGYIIYRFDAVENQWLNIAQVKEISYEDSNLASGIEYRYKVSAYFTEGETVYEGKQSEEVAVSITKESEGGIESETGSESGSEGEMGSETGNTDNEQQFIDSTIENFVVSKNYTTKIKLSWRAEKDAEGYEIYQYKNKKWEKVKSIKSGSAKSTTIKKLSPGNTYKFRIQGYKKIEGKTVYSKYKTLKVMTKPSKVKIKNVKAGTNKVTLQWKNVKSSGYEIQCSTWKTFRKNVKKFTIKKSKTKATVGKLKAGKTYYVRIRAYSKVNGKKYYGSWSKVRKVTVNRLLYTRKLDTSWRACRQEVMLSKFQPHASQMHLKWAEIRYCTQYAVYSNVNRAVMGNS